MKRLLFLNFHPAFSPPKSGGELRYFNLATRLSESFDVRMINPTFGNAPREEVRHASACVELRLPKTRAYDAWHRFFDRTARFRECSALVASLACRFHREYVAAAREAAASADVLILSSPFMWPAAPRPRRNQLLIYDAYNVESRLMLESLGDGFWGRRGTARIARIEGGLARRADLVLACSREDAQEMADLYGLDDCKVVVVPNGVDTRAVMPASPLRRREARARLQLVDSRAAFLFIGSFHPPNIEAMHYITQKLAREIPGADFLIAGKVCDAAPINVPPNARFLGIVDDATKADLLAAADVSLNPMKSGSGTNLKMLESLAAGLAIVSTPLGARGLEIESGRHAVIAGPQHFLSATRELAESPARREALARSGRELAEERFAWPVIVDRLRALIEHKTSPRLLLLNDYPVTPVVSGGQSRLHAVAQHLAKNAGPVTMVTLSRETRGRRVELGDGIEELNVPRSRVHRASDRTLSEWLTVAADDVTALLFWRATPALKRVLRREMKHARVLVLDHIYMAGVARSLGGKTPFIYESHNVETLMKRALYGPGLVGNFLVRATERAERWALRHAAFTSCVADEDRRVFLERFRVSEDRLVVAANGVDCADRVCVPADDRPRLREAIGMGREPVLLFVGSGHPPNRDAVEFVIGDIAPANPACTFLIVGSVCGWFHSRAVPENVIMLGQVDSEVKEYLLQCSDVALNTVFAGSGSSLKMPEYLSAGLPVLSSEVGARGFTGNGAREVIVLPREELAAAVGQYAGDLEWRRRAGEAARHLAERHYDWSVTLVPLAERVRAMLGQ